MGILPSEGAGQSEAFHVVATPAEERDDGPSQAVEVDGKDQTRPSPLRRQPLT